MTETRTAATIAEEQRADVQRLATLEQSAAALQAEQEQTERDYSVKLAAGADASELEQRLIRLETQVRGTRRAAEDTRARLTALEAEHKAAERGEAEEHVRKATAAAVAAGAKFERAVEQDRGMFAALDALRAPEAAAKDAEHALDELTGRTTRGAYLFHNEFWNPRRRLLGLRMVLEAYRDGRAIPLAEMRGSVGRVTVEGPGPAPVNGRPNMAFR